jgi:PAS domain S-box-containing protein
MTPDTGRPSDDDRADGGGAFVTDRFVARSDPEDITLLVVDDERNLLSIVADRLREHLGSLDVVTAKHGTEAMELLEGKAVDCIIADYTMPGMTGLELLAKARETEPGIPFILFTSKGSEDVAMEAIGAGATDYLQKNLSDEGFALLANRIENAVVQYRTRTRAREAERHVGRIHDYVTDGYIGLDEAWHITDLDEAAARLLGDSREALRGDVLWEAVPQLADSPLQSAFERAVSDDETVSFRMAHDGLDAHFEVHAIPSPDGLSAYFEDVTDRVESEEALERVAELAGELRAATEALDGDTAELDALVDELETAAGRNVD